MKVLLYVFITLLVTSNGVYLTILLNNAFPIQFTLQVSHNAALWAV
jgi:hypothetical protein